MADADVDEIKSRLDGHDEQLVDLKQMVLKQDRIISGTTNLDGTHEDGLADKIASALDDLAEIKKMIASGAAWLRQLPRHLTRGMMWFLAFAVPAFAAGLWGVLTHLAMLGKILRAIQTV